MKTNLTEEVHVFLVCKKQEALAASSHSDIKYTCTHAL